MVADAERFAEEDRKVRLLRRRQKCAATRCHAMTHDYSAHLLLSVVLLLQVQEKSAAKGKLETFAYSLKHAVEDSKTADKFSPTDRNTVLDAVRDVEVSAAVLTSTRLVTSSAADLTDSTLAASVSAS